MAIYTSISSFKKTTKSSSIVNTLFPYACLLPLLRSKQYSQIIPLMSLHMDFICLCLILFLSLKNFISVVHFFFIYLVLMLLSFRDGVTHLLVNIVCQFILLAWWCSILWLNSLFTFSPSGYLRLLTFEWRQFFSMSILVPESLGCVPRQAF